MLYRALIFSNSFSNLELNQNPFTNSNKRIINKKLIMNKRKLLILKCNICKWQNSSNDWDHKNDYCKQNYQKCCFKIIIIF